MKKWIHSKYLILEFFSCLKLKFNQFEAFFFSLSLSLSLSLSFSLFFFFLRKLWAGYMIILHLPVINSLLDRITHCARKFPSKLKITPAQTLFTVQQQNFVHSDHLSDTLFSNQFLLTDGHVLLQSHFFPFFPVFFLVGGSAEVMVTLTGVYIKKF